MIAFVSVSIPSGRESFRDYRARPLASFEDDMRSWRGGVAVWPGEIVEGGLSREEAEDLAARLSLASEVLDG